MSQALLTLNLTGISPEKFAVLQTVFTQEFKGGNHTTNSGTFIDDLATVDYTYDGKDVLVFNVAKIGRQLFKKPSLTDVQTNLVNMVEETVGKTSPIASLTETKPTETTQQSTETSETAETSAPNPIEK